MELDTVRVNGMVIARAEGRVDSANAREFQEALEIAAAGGVRAVILDLELLSYISSAGLRAILIFARDQERPGVKFAVCCLSEPVRRVFWVRGFDRVIRVAASREEAINDFTG